jgi:dienelactone hydrolase
MRDNHALDRDVLQGGSMRRRAFALTFVLLLAPVLTSAETPSTVPVTLKAPDGTALKATYFSPGRPGPGILLLHQCNRDRTSWTALATKAAERGYHLLALDYRGYGESGGQRFQDFQQQQPVVEEQWPGDIDAAFTWLTVQNGVDRNRIGAAGASCGVNQSILLARRHPEVKTVVLLSGNATPPAREYLRETPGLPVFGAASLDDGNAVSGMKWILGWSRNEQNTFVEFRAAGHGTDMFAVEAGLQPMILDWFDGKLRTAPATLPAPSSPPPPTAVEKFWTLLTKPGGLEQARRMFDDTRERDPKLILFPEGEMNVQGYSLLQTGNVKDAIVVFQMNVDAYPQSANTYDSLSDTHLAAGNREEALRLAEKALAVLESDEHASDEFSALVRESAEKKIKELRKK